MPYLFPLQLNSVYLQSLLWDVGHKPDQFESGLFKRNGAERNVFECTGTTLKRTDRFHRITYLMSLNQESPSCLTLITPAMLAKEIAVVGHKDDDRIVQPPLLLQHIHHPAQSLINRKKATQYIQQVPVSSRAPCLVR